MYSKAFEGCAAHGSERSIHCIYIYINIGGSVRSAARLGGDRSGVHDVTLIHTHCVLLNVLSV